MTRIQFAIVIVALSLLGCAGDREMVPYVRLTEFDCGRLNFDSLQPMGFSDDATDVRTLVTPCYIIEHPDGILLWEGGYESSLSESDEWVEMGDGWRIRLESPLSTQLTSLALTLADVDKVAFSHFHSDHIGIANEVGSSELIVQRKQLEQAFGDSARFLGFEPALYDQLDVANALVIEGDHDVFGDGRVRLISTPGHTLGHQSLLVDLPESGAVLLTGDLHILRAGLSTGWIPPFSSDSAMVASSIQKVSQLARELDAEIWIGHDLERFDSLRAVSNVFN